MKNIAIYALGAALLIAGSASADEKTGGSAKATVHRTADGHPDLSGVWSFAISLPPGPVKKVVDGKVTVEKADQSARYSNPNQAKGALPWTPSAFL